MKKFTADEFRRKPSIVYREADRGAISGEKVIINHGDYSDKVFELKAIERGSNWDQEEKQ